MWSKIVAQFVLACFVVTSLTAGLLAVMFYYEGLTVQAIWAVVCCIGMTLLSWAVIEGYEDN
jgi:peptidoglycan/LPS O-acetylase OafA/YrhL